jgi:leucyl aminopeptidase
VEGWLLGLYRFDKYKEASNTSRDVALNVFPEDWPELSAVELETGLGLAGIWGDTRMTQALVEIGERNGERLWPMPLVDDYESDLRSHYADMHNVGASGLAGAIIAALFIRRFVAESMDWVHIDMAGTVQYKQDVGYSEVGATGYGARLLADYAVNRSLSLADGRG